MDDEEGDEQRHHHEMNGARCLAAAEHVRQKGQQRVAAGRHGEPGQDHQREEDEQHHCIGELLQRVVVARVVEPQSRMVGDVARQPLDVAEGRHQFAEMAVDHAGGEPCEQRAHQQPGEEEMDHPAGGEVVMRRDRGPAWKRHIARPLGRAGHAEHAACVELRTEQLGVAAGPSLGVFGADFQHVVVEAEARLVADIECRMRVEYLQTGEQQEEQADRPHPMGDPRPGELPVDQRLLDRRLWNALGRPRRASLQGGIVCFSGGVHRAKNLRCRAALAVREPFVSSNQCTPSYGDSLRVVS